MGVGGCCGDVPTAQRNSSQGSGFHVGFGNAWPAISTLNNTAKP